MLRVNGEITEYEEGLTVQALLDRLGYATVRVAVERNRAIVPRAEYQDTVLQDGDVLEIVRFVGGG